MTITLCGENSFALQQELQAIVRQFRAAHGETGIEYVPGDTLRPAELRNQLQSVGLFSTKRLLVLAEPAASKELFAELPEIAGLTDADTTLIIAAGVLDKRTKTFKALQGSTDFRDFPLLSETQLATWVSAEVQKLGGSITAPLANTLVAQVGRNQWQLQNEVQKLVAYNPTISQESITLLVIPNLETNAFALLDAVMRRQSAQSHQLLAQLKTHSDPYEFFGLLVWQVNALALVAFAPANLHASAIASATGLKPFVVQKTQPLARAFGTAKVQAIVAQLAELDMQLKSTGLAPWLLIEQTLRKIAAT